MNKKREFELEIEAIDREFLLREVSDAKLIMKILKSGTDVDAQDADGYTALHYAVSENDLEKAKLLLEKGADVNARARYGITPRYICSLLRHAEMFKFLVAHKATTTFPERAALEKQWNNRMLKVYNPVHVKIAQHHAIEAGDDCDVQASMAERCRFGKRARLKQIRRIKAALEQDATLKGYQFVNEACV